MQIRNRGWNTFFTQCSVVLVSVNGINSFMTILIIIIFSFESNQINLDLLSNDAKFLQISEICCIASALNEFKMRHCSRKCISSSISNLHSLQIRSFNGMFWCLPFSISKLCQNCYLGVRFVLRALFKVHIVLLHPII
jgi:hypothetical protein